MSNWKDIKSVLLVAFFSISLGIFFAQEADAGISTAVSSVNPGWSNNRQRVVFYNGSRFFVLYSRGGTEIYYQSSTDNVTWSGESTLISDVSSIFDIYLVSDDKFDLVYFGFPTTTYVRTCTISGATIMPGNASAVEAITHYSLAVARSGTGNRIYVVGQFNNDFFRIYRADQTGDAQNVTSWTRVLEDSSVNPDKVAIVPYQGTDKVLVVYTLDGGGTNSDGVYSRWVTESGLGAETQCGDFNSLPDFSSPVRISDTDFRIIIRPPAGAMEEWRWNDVSWSQVDSNIDPDNETDHASPSLFYDRVSGDMYVFSVDTGTDDVERHRKPSGGSWQTEVVADAGEGTAHTYPITQMHEPPYGSSRTTSGGAVWGYRVVNGGNYDLKVGTLGDSFVYRRPITISNDMTPAICAGDVPDFPVLVSLTGTWLRTTASDPINGRVENANGYDIVFRASDGRTHLDHEIEKYDGTNGELVAWVRIPTLIYNGNTTIYMYYGNPSISSPTQTPNGVWNANYMGVWHLKESGSGTLNEFVDSTARSNHGTGGKGYSGYVPTRSAGQIGYAQTFDGSNDFIDMANSRWYDSNWPYRKRIVIQGSQVTGISDLSNFPVLINRTDIDWRYTGSGGHVGKTDGTDIFFTNDEGTRCDHEIESYNPATGELIAWVKVPELYHSANTTLYMYYGYAGAADQQNPAGVWSNGYSAVWHLKEDQAGTGGTDIYKDSTPNANHGDDWVSATGKNGQIDGGQQFDGVDDYALIPYNSPSLDFGTSFTVSAWIYPTNWGDSANSYIHNILSDETTTPDGQFSFRIGSQGLATLNRRLGIGIKSGGSYSDFESTSDLSLSTWQYGVVTYDGGNVRFYINGNLDRTQPFSGTPDSSSQNWFIGTMAANPVDRRYWEGNLDEVRVSKAVHPDAWILTEYNNQSSPSTFYQVLGEEQQSNVTLDLTGTAITIEAWVNYTASANWLGILTKGGWDNGYRLVLPDNPNPKRVQLQLPGSTHTLSSSGTITSAAWHHIVTTYDSSNMTIYINGGTPSTLGKTDNIAGAGKEFWIGHGDHAIEKGWSYQFNGGIDEIRISNVARDLCWVQTSYNNQNTPGTYVTAGAEESPAPTLVTLKSISATQYGDGVLLRWKTGYEVNNLGFHIYREESGQLVRLTPEPVAGSALLAGSRTALTAGHHYHWWDASLSPVRYWLKDIDLNGTETMHGPVTPVFSREPLPEKLRPELLSERGMRLEERYHHYWKVRELKEKIRSRGLRSAKGALRLRSSRTGNKVPLRTGPTGLEGRGFHRQPDPSTNELQRYLAGKSAVKLYVKEERWYRVTQPELVAAGLSSRINPKYLQLFVEGQEQPIRLIEGKKRRSASWDAVEFYGVGLDTPSTDTRVYWLIEGLRPGKRIEEHRSQGGQMSSSSFPYTIEKKERTIYFAALRNGEAENFFGPVVYMNQVDQILELQHLDRATSEDALLEVVLQGATETPHRVRVLLNEAEVGEVVFEGQGKGTLNVAVSHSELLEGENLVSLVASGDEMDATLLDTIRLTYWHTYTADNYGLRLTAQGGSHLTLSGFSHPKVRVIDITDSNDVIEVIGKVESQKGGYAISFRVPGTGQRTLLALAEERVKSPEGITPNQPSSWHQGKDSYDLVIVTHGDFFESLQPLKKLRESQGLKVAVIDVEDIYDEFSFGNKSPKAIKDFLGVAKKKWHRPPRFVLLVGDASFDPHNYLGMGDMDYVPTKLIDTVYMETASDDWFVDLNSDGLPEMAIGRLPVQTAEEAAIIVSKIVGYEKSSKKNEALLVADKSDQQDDFNFAGASEEVGALLPAYLTIRKIFRGQFSSDAQAKAELLSGINQGALLVNFIGHGSVESWRGSLLTLEDADSLINGLRLPFFVNMTCLNGFFQNPYGETLAEALMKASGGGAIAIWTSSGLTEPDKQAVMNKELIKLLFGRDAITLGEATAKAKASVTDQDIRKTWILFGDPSTRLK